MRYFSLAGPVVSMVVGLILVFALDFSIPFVDINLIGWLIFDAGAVLFVIILCSMLFSRPAREHPRRDPYV